MHRAKERVLNKLEEKHGLVLDKCAAGGTDKTGTSTTGNQGRRFFSEEVVKTVSELATEKYRSDILKLHKDISVVLRVVSCTKQIDLDKFSNVCNDISEYLTTNFKWAYLNDTLHATIHHAPELILLNDGYSLGALSEEGLEGNNKDIRNYLETHSRKTSVTDQITDVMHRLLERSDPAIIVIIQQQRKQKKCAVCGSVDHTIRSHDRKIKNFYEGEYNATVMQIIHA